MAKVVFLKKLPLIFGGRCNRYFWNIGWKFTGYLIQLVLTKFFKSELFSCLPKVDHVINLCKSWVSKQSYRVFSLTWPAFMQIYWNKRKRLHKKRVQLPGDWFGTPTWPPFHCFGTPIWPPWRHVKTLYNAVSLNTDPVSRSFSLDLTKSSTFFRDEPTGNQNCHWLSCQHLRYEVSLLMYSCIHCEDICSNKRQLFYKTGSSLFPCLI